MWLLSDKEFKGLKPLDFLTSWEGCMSAVARRARPSITWESPYWEVMKFNVDGTSRRKPGPSGIGGVLKNYIGITTLVSIVNGDWGFKWDRTSQY